jgi:predicted house-cleaning noncanonical NTP pyrophosphatase (MazG superfamily)
MSSLGEILRAAKEESGRGLGDLTVLSAVNDPFRLDTPTDHAAGAWLRDQMEAAGLLDRANPIHNRGIHYAIVASGDAKLPSGKDKNDADCWAFLESASKAARWLGYVPFEKIIDARNADPIIRLRPEDGSARAVVYTGALVELPDAIDLNPELALADFTAKQAYRLVFYGEKTSLGEVLEPLANIYDADLYLPSGEISDTLLATMAKVGANDGRPMVVFIFADCDPAGYQMAVSIGHKLRALKEGFNPSLKFQVYAPALTVEQVKTLGLPSTPLKETELRAAGWRARYGVEQTEIDALATLDPDALTEIVEEAVAPFYDENLAARISEAKAAWEEEAQQELEAKLDEELLEDIRARAQETLEALKEQLEAAASIDIAIDLPIPPIPQAEPSDDAPEPLVSSDMPLEEAIDALRARKDYSNGGDT